MGELLSVKQWAERCGKDARNARRLISEGRLPAVRVGSQWAIDSDTQPPPDKRVKSGKYKNWRKSQRESRSSNAPAF